jgi:hypothetical protein
MADRQAARTSRTSGGPRRRAAAEQDEPSADATPPSTGRQLRGAGTEALEATQAAQAGAAFQWHYGRVTRLGHFAVAGGKSVTILWEEGSITSQQGDITDEQWEIFRLAFLTTGRIALLSDLEDNAWMYDYRFLEAVR